MSSQRFFVLLCFLPLLPYVLSLNPLDSYFTGGRYLGLFTNQARLNSAGATYNSIAETNFNAATESNACKWETIEPSQNSFNFAACDFTANWITSRGGKFRGHTLVWHSQLAPWVSNLKGSAVDTAMKNHITTIMKHYAGKAYHWDVVNEALNDDGTLRSTVFSQQVGSDYITKAFTYARAADPNAKLYYNEYGLEFSGAKQDGAFKLVSDLKSKGLIDGIGLQGHLDVGKLPTNLKATVQRFANLGIEVAFTEVDIGTTTQDFTQQAKDYATLTTACVTVPGCVGITVGGVRDNESPSWRNGEYTLLFDENYQPKPAASALATAAAGGTGSTSTSATGSAPTSGSGSSGSGSSSGTVAQWGQCGGIGYTGPTVCASPYKCTVSNSYYSQCL
ncbi:hypothetical protein K435DRAFT_719999 [Dendrothele bispora CBS 962.96]|uniref:Beta-xylanase n=1 Tax=Dendrothele bispora (strain CBS 962.96) TaxID=1314807 RepID=A0A4S8M9N8_DENBC|nr:hypothetical protein K435DRAFT_719999 [Dendrothele bispora CBS 962.96]